jgi:hypothetical protein
MHLKEEAIASCRLDGAAINLDEFLAYQSTGRPFPHEAEVDRALAHLSAVSSGLQSMAVHGLTPGLFGSVHSRLGTEIPAEPPVQVLSTETDETDEPEMPKPPSPLSRSGARSLATLAAFLANDDSLPKLLRLAIAHGQWASAKPFRTGNEPMSRIVVALSLCEWRSLSLPWLPLSAYFEVHREQHDTLLTGALDGDGWGAWAEFFLDTINEAALEAAKRLTALVALREAHRELLNEILGKGAPSGLALLDSLYVHPYIDVHGVCDLTDLKFASANTLADKLLRVGLLEETTGGTRNRIFVYAPYMAWFRK